MSAAKLLVATIVAPPFAMKTADSTWEGLSIDLWHAVASKIGVEYEIQTRDTFGQLVDAVEKRAVDVVIALAASPEREIILDLSHPLRS